MPTFRQDVIFDICREEPEQLYTPTPFPALFLRNTTVAVWPYSTFPKQAMRPAQGDFCLCGERCGGEKRFHLDKCKLIPKSKVTGFAILCSGIRTCLSTLRAGRAFLPSAKSALGVNRRPSSRYLNDYGLEHIFAPQKLLAQSNLQSKL